MKIKKKVKIPVKEWNKKERKLNKEGVKCERMSVTEEIRVKEKVKKNSN